MDSPPDRELQHHVESELFACPGVDDTDIAVKVNDGTVTLSGYARSFFDKYGAEDAVKRVRGVAAIANDIEVRPRFPRGTTDPEIARAAVAALRHALPRCGARIMPLVRAGVVTLEGVLDWNSQRELAESTVREACGVATVINAIRLTLVAPA